MRVTGLGSATETSSILDRETLTCLEATRRAAQIAYWRAGIANPRELEGLAIEVHDAFNSLLPIGLIDLGLVDADDAIAALVGHPKRPQVDPYAHPVTGVRGSIPTNLSGGLKARGHPVGGTGLFQIAETYLQLTERFPNPRAQVRDARVGIAQSVGGPGNNNYVTIIEKTDNRRTRSRVADPRQHFESSRRRPEREEAARLHGSRALVEAATSIHVTSGAKAPVHVALLSIDGQRVFAKLDRAPREEEPLEEVLAGQKVKFLVKDDGDQYFQIPRGRSFDLGRLTGAIRRRVGRRRAAAAARKNKRGRRGGSTPDSQPSAS